VWKVSHRGSEPENKPIKLVDLLILIVVVVSLCEPLLKTVRLAERKDEVDDAYLEERFASFPDFLAGILVYVFFADMGAPLGDDFLIQDIDLVEFHQNLRHFSGLVRVGETEETLNTSKEGLLVFFGVDHLVEFIW
jgi:hypothetical protein